MHEVLCLLVVLFRCHAPADDFVYQSVLFRFIAAQEAIPIRILFDPSQWLASVFAEDLVEVLSHPQDFACMNANVASLSFYPSPGLVDHDAGVGQGEAFPFRACSEQQRAHARGLAKAKCSDIRLYVLHGVVDRHACGDRAARRVDVEIDILVRVFRLKKEQLRGYERGDLVVDRRAENHDAISEETGEKIIGSFSSACRFNNGRWIRSHSAKTLA